MLKSLNANALGPKRTVQMLLGAAVLVLVVGGIIMFLMDAQIHDMQATLSAKEALVGTSEQTAKKFEQTQKDYDEVAARTQYLEASVSAKSFVPTLLKQLQALAMTTHLTVTSVRPGTIMTTTPPAVAAGDAAGAGEKKVAPLPYDTLDIGVDVVGTYADTAAFLYNLTRFPKIISVASVQMRPGGDAGAAGVKAAAPSLTTNLHLTAFVFHGDVDAPATAAGAASPGAAVAAAVPPPSAAAAPAAAAPTGVTTTAAPPAPSSAVSEAAAHAAGQAIGATKAAQARSEAGIQTL